MKIITVWNLKGGTGKTTTTFNLAANLANDNKVLLLDLDMQANLTSFFDIDTKNIRQTDQILQSYLIVLIYQSVKVYIIQDLKTLIILKALMML